MNEFFKKLRDFWPPLPNQKEGDIGYYHRGGWTRLPFKTNWDDLTDSGQTTLHSHVGEGFTAWKSDDETVNNSSTLQDDDDLILPLAANEVWAFRMFIWINTGSTPDFKLDFSAPSGATGSYYFGVVGTDYFEATLSTDHTVPGTGADDGFIIHGVVINGSNAGNLVFRWAQNTADMSDTTVKAGSYLIAHELT